MVRTLLVLLAIASAARADVRARAHAARRAGPITIDGRLDDRAWEQTTKHSGFTQRFPKDGVPAALETRFAVVYDDAAIYVGVWADDPEPAKIRKLLTRRDVPSQSDIIGVAIDSYRDRRTAYVFQLNAAGVQRDSILFDDSQEDTTWDAVWTGEVAIGAAGWTAEFRIPLNQLRFSAADTQEWGIQVLRSVPRTQEQTAWAPWPRSAPEVVSKFGVVDGIAKLRPGRRLELLPYATGGFEAIPIADGDPLNESTNARGNVGLDLEYGLSSAFTLSAAINPDFGQVEADPSQVNLSANELFFAEKRPFFLEGVDLFKLPIGNSDSSVEGAFYSRRIGAAPPRPEGAYDYARVPTATTIYGAMKLTGKTSGWSIGVFDAVTGSEAATIAGPNGTMDVTVAPLTNYAVGRLKRDFDGGRSAIGLSATAVHRALDDTPLAASLHDQAYTAGLQLQHRFGKSAWEANVSTVGSLVHGSREAIAATQTAARHLYQRPDATNARFDPDRTSLAGLGATWKIGKFGDTKRWRYGMGGDMRTIGLELNDLGFQHHSDRAIPFVWGQIRDDSPGDAVLNWEWNSDVYLVSTLEPELVEYGLECNGHVQLVNYWTLSASCNLENGLLDPAALRGGRTLAMDPNVNGSVEIATDPSKPVSMVLGAFGDRTWATGTIGGGFELGAIIQARSNIDLFIGPSFAGRTDGLQYIDQVDDTEGTRHYVFGRIRQTTASLTMRLNWTFTPRLALQAYAQPFVATGRYSQLKDVDDPRAARFADRFTSITGADYTLAGDVYTVRTATGASYRFDRPDFAFRQLRSTLVVRWEYRPGSTVFAIWSHGRTSSELDGRFRPGTDLRGLAAAGGENIVMVKANYWIGL